MAAISSRAAGGVENKYKFNAGTELSEELYIQYYETPIRNYDPQIGRFTGIDVLAEYTYGINPYQFCINNPVMFIDPDGMRPWAPSESGQDGGAQIDYSSYSSGNGRYDWSRADAWENGVNLGNWLASLWFAGGKILTDDVIIRDKIKEFVKAGDYIGAFRFIMNSYSIINEKMKEGVDYKFNPKVENGGGFTTESTSYEINEKGELKILTSIAGIWVRKGMFDDFVNSKVSFAGLVGAVYHESVHVRLIYGKESNYGKVVPLRGTDGSAINEVIASYLQLTVKIVATPMRPNEIKTMSNYGIVNYNLIVKPEQKQKFEPYYNYFLTQLQKYK